jgi:hypothetical protein
MLLRISPTRPLNPQVVHVPIQSTSAALALPPTLAASPVPSMVLLFKITRPAGTSASRRITPALRSPFTPRMTLFVTVIVALSLSSPPHQLLVTEQDGADAVTLTRFALMVPSPPIMIPKLRSVELPATTSFSSTRRALELPHAVIPVEMRPAPPRIVLRRISAAGFVEAPFCSMKMPLDDSPDRPKAETPAG